MTTNLSATTDTTDTTDTTEDLRAPGWRGAGPQPSGKQQWLRRQAEHIASVGTIVGLLALWELLGVTHVIDTRILSTPIGVARELVSMLAHRDFGADIGVTLERYAIGMAVSVVPGALLGITMGLYRWPRVVLRPIVAALYPVPRIAMFPLILILIGLNATSNIVMIAIGPFFTMLITAMAAVLGVDPIYRDVARSFGTGRVDLYRRVVLPAALPVLLGGVRISAGLALMGTVAVEFLVTNNGVGHVIWNSWQVLSLQESMAGLVVAGVIGFLSYLLVDGLQRLVVRWQSDS